MTWGFLGALLNFGKSNMELWYCDDSPKPTLVTKVYLKLKQDRGKFFNKLVCSVQGTMQE